MKNCVTSESEGFVLFKMISTVCAEVNNKVKHAHLHKQQVTNQSYWSHEACMEKRKYNKLTWFWLSGEKKNPYLLNNSWSMYKMISL